MRELELAGHPSIDPPRGAHAVPPHPLARPAVVISILAHLLAAYALSLQQWGITAPVPPVADFFLFELPRPRPPEPAAEPSPDAAVPTATAVEERQAEPVAPPAAEPRPESIAAPEAPPAVETPGAATSPTEPVDEVRAAEPAIPRAFLDFDEERRRAARDVISERSKESEFLTFSMDDVVSPRPEAAPERKSIFDLNTPPSSRSVMQPGQARTKFGRKVAELCNALTGGFAVGFQGFRLFSACGDSELGPTGLYPEVRPAYLDLMPECEDTRDTAPALALEAPFSTVKCRLVKRDRSEE